jgi:DNA-binding CsgD family transcriptional regulator
MAAYLDNEFLQEDFIKFSALLRNRQSVGVLSEATRHELHRSQRFRNMLAPMAIGDELRAVFVSDAACWGTLCLHRGPVQTGYTSGEAAFLAQLAPHIADGLRKALLLDNMQPAETLDEPGVLILTDDLSTLAVTSAAERWLKDLTEAESGDPHGLPLSVRSVVTILQAIERGLLPTGSTPKVRLHTRSGHWLVVHASRLRSSEGSPHISVIFEVARPAEIAPLVMQAYQLTRREGEITQCVLRGWSTAEISASLHITLNTVQDHLKAIFAKVDVSSRGELAARIFARHYQP